MQQAEQQMVSAYGYWMSASSEVVLPVLEEILAQEMIPQLQRQIVATIPSLAQTATASIANRNTGRPSPRDQARGPIIGVLWRTRVEPVGGASESMQGQGTLPAIDPATDQNYLQQAVTARNSNASRYLEEPTLGYVPRPGYSAGGMSFDSAGFRRSGERS